MSKDPFEELFGPEANEEPQPVPARERLSFEQAERVRTAPLPTKQRSQPPMVSDLDDDSSRASRGISASAKPWIIVGIVAVVAIVAAIIVLNIARAGSDETPAPTPTASAPAPAPTTAQPTTPADDDDADDEGDEDEADGVPSVEVGPTNTMPIGPWNATSELSQRFGQTSFAIPDGVNLVLTNDLLNSFPESCAAMRQGWGATQLDGGRYEVLKPDTRCQAAPELYDEVWGLLDAWVKTIRPA